jgi:polyhydroxyalkanoate synthase subunit PhaC
MTNLMAWNADVTRLLYQLHSEYLRQLFLHNDLAEDRFVVDGHPVSLRDIRALIFAVATVSHQSAPWRSVYKIQMLTDADVTFLLSRGATTLGSSALPANRGGIPACGA